MWNNDNLLSWKFILFIYLAAPSLSWGMQDLFSCSMWDLSFIEPIFAWNVPLVSLIFLKRSLVFPILLFSSISLHCSLKKAFSSLLAILWKSAFNGVYLSLAPLPLASPHFSAICKASSDNHFNILHFFFLGMILATASCTMLRIFVHSSSGTLSTRSNPLNLFVTCTI